MGADVENGERAPTFGEQRHLDVGAPEAPRPS
jgi:hypothetical protein